MQEILLKIRYFEWRLSESRYKLTLFFIRKHSFLMENIMKKKLVTSSSSNYRTSLTKFLFWWCITWPSLMMKYKAVSELFQKLHLLIYASQFMISQIISLWFLLLNLENVETKEKITKLWISQEQRELFR